MSDTEEDSASSDSWPIDEHWLIEMLKKHHEVRDGIKITVSAIIGFPRNYNRYYFPSIASGF